MYIYKKEDNLDKIQIFSFNEDKKQAHDFREEEIKKIRRDRRCFYYNAILPSSDTCPVFFYDNYKDYRLNKETIRYFQYKENLGIVNKSGFVGRNRNLRYYDFKSGSGSNGKYSDYEMIEILSNNYIDGFFINNPVVVVDFLKKIRYFLLTSNFSSIKNTNKGLETTTDGIIEIPKSLYLLQMLEQEKYERIQEEDIKDQLELFTYNYIDTINLEEIKRMEDCGMVINLVKKTNDKIQNDKAIIKKLKL